MIIALSTHCLLNNASPCDYSQTIEIDTSIRMLETTPSYSTDEALTEHRYLEKRLPLKKINFKHDYYLIFRYRDTTFLGFWQKMVLEWPKNDLIKVWYINAVTQMKREKYLPSIARYRNSGNGILRECAANAYGFLAGPDSISALQTWLLNEPNCYVQRTIEASIRAIKQGGYKSRISYLPKYYPEHPLKLQFVYNVDVSNESDMDYQEQDSTSRGSVLPAGAFVYPCQQYLWRIKHAQRSGYFGSKHGPIYHIGVDAMWMFEGLPVHSICDGIVKSIVHNLSWGTMVVVEAAITDHDTACIIYGHLSPYLDFKAGDTVRCGDKIGQIGNSVSFENGGYWAHLHCGIEKLPYSRARRAGYDIDTAHYEDPVRFIREHQK